MNKRSLGLKVVNMDETSIKDAIKRIALELVDVERSLVGHGLSFKVAVARGLLSDIHERLQVDVPRVGNGSLNNAL